MTTQRKDETTSEDLVNRFTIRELQREIAYLKYDIKDRLQDIDAAKEEINDFRKELKVFLGAIKIRRKQK